MYLPQFHRVKENDEWWGEGFTDWVSAKNAEVLFEGHYQPHVPLDGYYYDLMDKKTMQWQAELMHKYGVDGMCMYHYWFKDGRQILEKPVEKLLEWSDINMPFCFCWANETWARSWSNLVASGGLSMANVWSDKFETSNAEGKNGILLEQKYGNREQWKQHFEYLLPFFKDSRYIRIDNKPLFMIYETSKITCLGDMLDYWRELALENDLDGIYIIGAGCSYSVYKYIDAAVKLQPKSSIGKMRVMDNWTKELEMFSYDSAWDTVLAEKPEDIKTYFGGFVGYDDTPRRGKNGCVIKGATPEKFKQYLRKLFAKNMAYGNDITFINAWNEWGEGMHLEPDEENKYEYLDAISEVKKEKITELPDIELSPAIVCAQEDELRKNQILRKKNEDYLRMADYWLSLKEQGRSLAQELIHKGIKSVLIYGCGIFFKHLSFDLLEGNIKIKGIIDQRGEKLSAEYEIFTPDDVFPDVDLIIIATPYYYEEMAEVLKAKGYSNYVSLENLIMEAL